MKLGMINGWDEASIKNVSDFGLWGVEFCINHNYDSAEVLAKEAEIRRNLEKYGVHCGSIGRWGETRVDDDGKVVPAALQHDHNIIDLAAALSCPVVNVGMNRAKNITMLDNYKIAAEYFAGLLDYAKARGIKLATYNCDWGNIVYDDSAWSVVHNQLPELGIKYDASHSIHRHFGHGEEYLREMRDWGDRFYHVHVKGTTYAGGVCYYDPPAGLDDIRWGAWFNMLYVHGYDGMLSIEPHSQPWSGKLGQWGVQFTINFLKPFIMPENFDGPSKTYMP